MQRIALADDIHSLSEFRSKTAGFISQVHSTKRPLVITQNGKSAAVLLDVGEYEDMVEKIEMIQDIRIATEQIVSGRGVAHEKAHKTLRAKYSK
jgi:prevent-host-death family protein